MPYKYKITIKLGAVTFTIARCDTWEEACAIFNNIPNKFHAILYDNDVMIVGRG